MGEQANRDLRPLKSMHTTIVPAAAANAAAILAIQKRAFAEEARLSDTWEIPPLTETAEAIADHIRTQTALVARDGDNTIIGSVRGLAVGTVCTIRGLSIEPAHQGQGIGAALLKAIEAAHPKATRFELTTNTVMAGNVRFYERHGYQVHELTRHSDKITLAQMSKARAEP
jgi:predicted N-acetyltransferase YhbS